MSSKLKAGIAGPAVIGVRFKPTSTIVPTFHSTSPGQIVPLTALIIHTIQLINLNCQLKHIHLLSFPPPVM